jgi:3-methyladenine DNA glycosylase AlkD
LERLADPKTRAWFESYLKGAIPYRGVKTPQIVAALTRWRRDLSLDDQSPSASLEICRCLVQGEHADDKFAAFLWLQRGLALRLTLDALMDEVEWWFNAGLIHDWSTSDWLCVRVLGPALVRGGEPVAQRLQGWFTSEHLWQKRSSLVAFRPVVADAGWHPRIASGVAALVSDDRRFIQTGVGWVLADLGKVHPGVAAGLVETHFEQLSAEVIRRHTRGLPDHEAWLTRVRAR